MKKKRIVSLLLVCVMVLSLLPTNIVIAADPSEIFASGSGDGSSADTAYIINTAEQLKAFSKSVTDGDGNDYSGKYIKLMADIDLGGDESNQWLPIGNSITNFKGIFDGNNKKITGLYIDNSSDYQGLFGYIGENANIKSLGVSGNIKGSEYVGGLVGRNEKGKITNCYYEGSVSGYSCVGGLVGRHGANGSEITSCYNAADVNGTGQTEVGGIAGFGAGKIQNCYNIGEIYSEKDYVGGIAGSTSQLTEMDSCYNIGKVTGSGTYVGSIIGSFTQFGVVTKCYYLTGTANRGAGGLNDQENKIWHLDNISSFNDQTTFVGWDFTDIWVIDSFEQRPVLKNNREGSLTKSPYRINNLADLEKLSKVVSNGNTFQNMHFKLMTNIDMSLKYGADKANSVSDGSWKPIGDSAAPFDGTFDGNNKKITGLYIDSQYGEQGLFGYIGDNGDIKNLGVFGNVKGNFDIGGIVGFCASGIVENCYYEGTVSGNMSIGGIVGNMDHGLVENCYNKANVNCANFHAGGIVGRREYGTVENCYNIGRVAANKEYGGIVGYQNMGNTRRCYNAGELSKSGSAYGGVVGKSSNSDTVKCYYLNGTAAKGIGDLFGTNTKEATGITAEQMRDVNTFTEWNFTKTWEMGGEYLNRPILKNNKEIVDGEEENPYLIYTLADLEKLSSNIDTADYGDKHFKLMADINMGEKYGEGKGENGANLYWTPIGNIQYSFDGIFDGNGKTVSNVYTDSESDYQGLFGCIDNGTVKNLTVSGTIKGQEKVGAIAGFILTGLIENCHNTATTTVNGQKTHVGGIVGGIYTQYATVKKCSNSATVSNNSETHVGGITGQNYGMTEMCINKGSVSASDGKCGGIVGVNSGTLRNCYNQGSVDGREQIGGIVGYNAVKTENCYSVGDVKSNDYNSLCGSIAGVNGSRNNVPGVITNCYYLSTRIGGIGKTQVMGSAESRTEEEFNSGSVAWALQNNQEDKTAQVWGQNIGSDNYPDLTSDNAKSVCKVAFMKKTSENSFVESTAKYLNKGKTIGTDNMPQDPESEEYTFIRWSQTQDTEGATFDGNTTVNGDMSIYAVGSGVVVEPEAAPSKTIKLRKNELMTQGINLKDYVEYAAGDSKDDILIAIADGSTLPAGLTLSGSTISGTPTCNAGKYTVNFTVRNNNISLYSMRGAVGDTLELIFDIGLEGEGTELKPYKIDNADELVYFCDDVNIGGEYGKSGVYVKLTSNIDLSSVCGGSVNWVPIGCEKEFKYCGVFDGDNKEISNLYINSFVSHKGLFGYNDGIIKNLVVSGQVTGGDYVGGIVGENLREVENCYNKATVTGERFVGGIAGDCGSDTVNVSNCHNSGTIYGKNYPVGGITGLLATDRKIINCYNTGEVKGDVSNIGGIVGENYGIVQNCYNTSEVKGNVNNIGGIVGENYGIAQNCYNTGKVALLDGSLSGNAIGGIVGAGERYNGKFSSVTNCYYLFGKANSGVGSNYGTGNAESRTEEEFNNGSVAWALQNAQVVDTETQTIPQIWGQKIVDTSTDAQSNNDAYPIFTSNSAKKVYRVRLYKNDEGVGENVIIDTKYVNTGDRVTIPKYTSSIAYKGWAEAPTGYTDYLTDDFDFNYGKDTDLYAVWKGALTFNPPDEKQTYTAGTSKKITPTPLSDGQVATGISADDFTVKYYEVEENVGAIGKLKSTVPNENTISVGKYLYVIDIANAEIKNDYYIKSKFEVTSTTELLLDENLLTTYDNVGFMYITSGTEAAQKPIYFTKQVVNIKKTESVSNPLVNPNQSNVTYESSDTSVATVDANTGAVTINGAGSTVIVATSHIDNTSDVYASYTLNVTKEVVTVTPKSKNITYGETFADDGYEVSKEGVTLSGTPTYTTDYTSGDGIGKYEINLSGLTSDDYDIEYKSGKLTVAAKPITLNNINVEVVNGGKTYDGSDNAVLSANITESELVSGDKVTVLVSGTYDSANAGDRTVSYEVTGLSGKDSSNYTLSGNLTGNKSAVIQQAVVNVSMPASVTYVYDTYEKSITAMAYANGIYFDKFKLVYRRSEDATDLEGLPTDRGTYIVRVIITDNNYKLPDTEPTATLKINPAQQDFLSIEGVPDTVTYGDPDINLQTAGGIDGGMISYEITEGSSLVEKTDNKLKLVGVGKVTVKAISTDANDNYAQKSATRTFVIRPKTLYVTATATNRVYNGDKNISVSFNNDSVTSQIVGTDSVNINYTSATVATADVENNKTVFVNGLTVDNPNYQLATTSVQTTVDIEKATISAVEMTAPSKTYDTTDTADYTITNLVGVINEDKNFVTLTGTAKFNSANVSEANKVTLNELVLSGSKSGNYKLSDSIDKVETAASISKANVNFTLGTCSYVYDGKPHTADVTATVDGKPFTYYRVTYNGETSATDNGEYPIAIIINEDISDNYIGDYDNANPQKFTIVQADQSEMTIMGLVGTIDYDKEFALSVVGGSNGDTMMTTWSTSNENIAAVNSATGVVKINGVGNEVTITATKTDSAGNHKPQTATVKFTPVKKDVSFKITGLDFTYDGNKKSATVTPSYNKMTEDDYTVTYINENGETLTQEPTNAGKYYVEVKAKGGYEGEQNAVLTIKKAKRDMTGIDIILPEGDIVYGSDYTIGSTYNGLDDKITYAGTGIYGTQDTQPTNAGNYTAILTIESDNYETATVTKSFKIEKAPLGVWAQSTSRPFGTANQPFTIVYRLTDLKRGDSIENVVLNAPIATTTADASTTVGTYDITVSGGTADNYNFVPVIDAADKDKNILTIESATGGQLLIVGSTGTASVGQTFALSVFYGAININGNVSWSSDNEAVATVDENGIVTTHMAGKAKITATADANYGEATKDLDLNVEKTEVSLSPVNTVKTYNGEVQGISLVSSNKNFTPVTDGIGQNVTVTYTLATDSSVTEPKNVGTYVVSYVINDDNFSGVGNTLMYINKANVELKPKDITKTYGSTAMFMLEETSGSLLSDEKLAELTSLVTFTSDGAVNTAAVKDGGYEITATMDSIADENMNITLKGTGLLTVEKAPLTIKVKDVIREYGAENPKLETEISGLVNGETKSVLKGEEQLAYADSIKADTPVGTYPDSTSVSGLTADNYEIEFKGGNVEVTIVDVTASGKTARSNYITIRFDKPMAGLTVDNFEVKKGETPVTLTSVTPSADNKTYTLNGKFTVGTKYTVTPKITSDTHRIVSEPLTITPSRGESGGSSIGGGGSSGGGGIGGGVTTSTYTVKFDTNGGNSIDSVKVEKNAKVTEPTAPTKNGYTFDGWYTDSKLTTKYDFNTKVTQNITLYAKWTEGEEQPEFGVWKNPFVDVKDTDWFFNSVRYANENKLMGGTSENTFAPNEALTRGMLVTVLYRAEGEPAVNKSIPFADVKGDMYYANAVNWAQQNGIVNGVSETEFAPEDNITREQIAAIIYRYAKFKDIAPTGAWAIRLDYADLNEISDYAAEGVMYCALQGIMQGKENNCFAPKDNATRAEIAAILQRFIEGNK